MFIHINELLLHRTPHNLQGGKESLTQLKKFLAENLFSIHIHLILPQKLDNSIRFHSAIGSFSRFLIQLKT